jgi:hypothetical protein
MPGYIDNALHKFQHTPPYRPQHALHPARKLQYGSKVQLTPEVVDSPTLAPAGKKRIQQVVGALLYYARAVEPTPMTASAVWNPNRPPQPNTRTQNSYSC